MMTYNPLRSAPSANSIVLAVGMMRRLEDFWDDHSVAIVVIALLILLLLMLLLLWPDESYGRGANTYHDPPPERTQPPVDRSPPPRSTGDGHWFGGSFARSDPPPRPTPPPTDSSRSTTQVNRSSRRSTERDLPSRVKSSKPATPRNRNRLSRD